jgi:signal transduction histidine kinase
VGIVRQLLDLARPYNFQREPLDLKALISSTLELLEEEARSSHVLTEIQGGDWMKAEGDKEVLQQVFNNIAHL